MSSERMKDTYVCFAFLYCLGTSNHVDKKDV